MIPAITLREIAAALYGAVRLARGDAHGIDFFEDSVDGFWKSFWAAAIVAPAYAILLAINLDDAEIKSGILRIAIVELTAYVAGWAAFPLAMHYVAEFMDREERYLRYIAAANWCAVIQVGLYLFVTAFLAFCGSDPDSTARDGVNWGGRTHAGGSRRGRVRRIPVYCPLAGLSRIAQLNRRARKGRKETS